MHRFSSHKNLRESIRYTFKRYAPTDTPKVGKREGKGSSLLCQIIQEEKELTRTLLATVKRPLHFCTCIPALPSQAGGSNAPFTRSKLVLQRSDRSGQRGATFEGDLGPADETTGRRMRFDRPPNKSDHHPHTSLPSDPALWPELADQIEQQTSNRHRFAPTRPCKEQAAANDGFGKALEASYPQQWERATPHQSS
jgi:hypothetical protein